MKSWLSFVLSISCASAVLAEPPPRSSEDAKRAAALIEKEILQPLQKAEARRSSFSRVGPVPAERRVHVLDDVSQVDAHGKRFVRFAIDVRYGWKQMGAWSLAAVRGCAYVEQKQVFVREGDGYIVLREALRGETKSRSDVCQPASTTTEQTASAAR